ncbi:MAG: T9SS type A sorting domain-containing protein [Cytophagales bacterium]
MRLLATFYLSIFCSFSLFAQSFSVPDDDFKSALIGAGMTLQSGSAGDFLNSEAETFTSLDVSSASIADMSGIEHFINLDFLDCKDNAISTLDLSSNDKLKTLLCWKNTISNISLHANAPLEKLNLSENNLSSLDLTGYNNIYYLNISDNNFSNLNTFIKTSLVTFKFAENNISGTVDLNGLTLLQNLDCQVNAITALNIDPIAPIKVLRCHDNQLSSLQITNRNQLTTCNSWSNSISQLDLSNSPNLSKVNCHSNQMSDLNISNSTALTYLSVKNNSLSNLDVSGINSLATLKAENNSLTCIQVNQTQLNAIPSGWSKDAATSYSLNCNNCGPGTGYTCIPDGFFEDILAPYDDNPNDNKVPTATISTVLTLNVSNSQVSDLTGIEDFTALEILAAGYNDLTHLDVSNNLNLKYLGRYASVVNGKQLIEIVLPNNGVLEELYLWSNNLNFIDVSGQNNLINFDSRGNNFLNCIQVNSTQLANIPVGWLKNSQTTYNIDCSNAKTGIVNILQQSKPIIYPNPFSNSLTLSGLYNMKKLQIMDMNGREVLSEEINSVQKELNMSGFDKGMYILTLISNDGTFTREKIVKQ